MFRKFQNWAIAIMLIIVCSISINYHNRLGASGCSCKDSSGNSVNCTDLTKTEFGVAIGGLVFACLFVAGKLVYWCVKYGPCK